MKRVIAAGLLLVSGAAWAGEMLLGKIASVDGGIASNRCTTTAFVVPSNAKLTIQCPAAAAVGTGVAGCDGGVCLVVSAETMFPTSTGPAVSLTCTGAPLSDGGFTATTYYGGWVSVMPVVAAPMTCKVFQRSGTE